jgi:hypothetical protein
MALTATAGGVGSGVSVFAGSQVAKDTALMTALNYTPSADTSSGASIRYRAAGTTSRASYSLLIWKESISDWCKINFGQGVSSWQTFSDC